LNVVDETFNQKDSKMSNDSKITFPLNISLDKIFPKLPEKERFAEGVRRAPKRSITLNQTEIGLAVKNALRYIPCMWHSTIAPEFLKEIKEYGRVYGYRFRPKGRILAMPIDKYSGKCLEGKAFQSMIDNNLDFEVALYPYELVTYGETGQVCQNWMQYRLIKCYLEMMTRQQTLVIQSGHPLGLFRSDPNAPRVLITNGLMVGMFDDPYHFNKAAAMGVANYGQMTAGGWMYIGPQGIVHGTYSTLLNAGRTQLGISSSQDLTGFLFVSSGLGGMSGAQGKAVEIANGVGIIAEVDSSRIKTRKEQGWIGHVTSDPKEAFSMARLYQKSREKQSIAFSGNVVDLLKFAVENKEKIDLLSDQTSCHVAYDGGYCPKGLTFDHRTELLKKDPLKFRNLVDQYISWQPCPSYVNRPDHNSNIPTEKDRIHNRTEEAP